jgi:hypothetical protein
MRFFLHGLEIDRVSTSRISGTKSFVPAVQKFERDCFEQNPVEPATCSGSRVSRFLSEKRMFQVLRRALSQIHLRVRAQLGVPNHLIALAPVPDIHKPHR